MEIILFQPQIPQNTGNIIRTCKATNTKLVLVEPLGFKITNRWLKRAGLDYWDGVEVATIDNLETYLEGKEERLFFFSSKVSKPYTSANYTNSSILIFGSETAGLPPHFFEKWKERFVTIPMNNNARCLNLSNSVAIGIYEAHRQTNYKTLQLGLPS